MRVLITGATGFIGSALAQRLAAAGEEIVSVSRGDNPQAPHHFAIDMARAKSSADWSTALQGVDAVVNCAGVFQSGAGDTAQGVLVDGADALFAACEQRGVRRVIHLSAAGIGEEAPSEFSRSKRAGEEALRRRDLDWVILRPGVVIGRGAYGGSALIRGLAALPIFPSLPGTGPVQLADLDDLLDTILFFLRPGAPSRITLDIVTPRRWGFDEIVDAFRQWMRWPRARTWNIPGWAARLLYLAGDAAARARLAHACHQHRGAGDDARRNGRSARWREVTGIAPRELGEMFLREPASVQERWFARLYVSQPLVFGVFGVFWIATGLISLGPGYEYGMALLREGGLPERFGMMTLVAGALADIVIGIAILYRPLSRYGLYAALIISLVYVVIGTALVPRLWADPLRPDAENLACAPFEPCRACHPGGPVTLYFAVKFLHVIGAAVLLGTGAGIAFFMLVAHLRGNTAVIAGVARIVVLADFLFTATAVVLQPVTGVWLAWHTDYSLLEGWIFLSIVLYIVTGLFWLPVVWMQMSMRDLAAHAAAQNRPLPPAYHRLFWWWFAFGFPHSRRPRRFLAHDRKTRRQPVAGNMIFSRREDSLNARMPCGCS